ERRRACLDREPIELDEDGKTRRKLRSEEQLGLPHRDRAGRNRPRPRARHSGIDIAVDDVVIGAAGAAHHDGTHAKQNEQVDVMPGGEGPLAGNGAQRQPEHAGPEEQPPRMRPVQPHELEERPRPGRQLFGPCAAHYKYSAMGGNELTYPGGKLRLYVEAPLGQSARVVPDEGQAHYLLHVMRARPGDRISLFNGRDGEWLARIAEVSKRSCSLECEGLVAPQREVPDLWLCFAPIKKTPADYVVQKATELGVSVLQPVFTRRT